MLFTRYNILVFRSTGERVGSFHARGWFLPALALLMLVLLAGNVMLWNHFSPYALDRQRLQRNLKLAERQRAAINDLSFDIVAMEKRFAGIADLSGKLAVMLNLESGEQGPDASAMGGKDLFLYGLDGRMDLVRQAHAVYRQLVPAVRQQEVRQQVLLRELAAQRENLTRIPSIWPVRGRFSSPFGYRKNPVTHRVAFHKGIDISAPTGTPIMAPAAGTITFAKWFSTYGKTVEITHGNGLKTRFAHMSSIDVEVGDTVKRGDPVGKVGNTGRSVAPHLHYEVHKNGRPVNPMFYIMDG